MLPDPFPTAFDLHVGIDWTGAQPARGIAIAVVSPLDRIVRPVPPPGRHWRREEAVNWLLDRLAQGRRLLIGIDCAFSLPWVPGAGYLDGRVPGVADLFALWDLVEAAAGEASDDFAGAVVHDPRFAPSFWIAGPTPPHWGDGSTKRRRVEVAAAAGGFGTPVSVFKLAAASKQVGKASLAGMRSLRRLRREAGGRLAVWPAEPVGARSVVCEIYPTLFRRRAGHGTAKLRTLAELERALAAFGCALPPGFPEGFDDHTGDAMISAAGLLALAGEARVWTAPEAETARREGWIFGVDA
ncbi:hypothetical protein [Rhodospirillum centenum]|uniref:DUF429 domain-containing protein n=1 Tax=Rhodospirillum centenum (strain ATCC 51521 / SW) TaxID=414684 RepID=B6IQX7_RHOCS|nr:hypothetical protein [Rhodospirillum centenum]ACI97863.1 conserved hypothetical protein [Rhodospirillum centenum SW]